MNIELHSGNFTAEVSDAIDTKQQMRLHLDFLIQNFVKGKTKQELVQEIALNGHRIRKEIFKSLIEEHIPHVARKLGTVDHDRTIDYHSKHRFSGTQHIDEQRGTFRNMMDITINVKTDTPVSAAQALYMIRGGLAGMLADSFLNGLQSRYLGKHRLKSRDNTVVNGDKLVRNETEFDNESLSDN